MKETKKQIKAQLINEMSKKLDAKFKDVEERATRWKNNYYEACAKCNELAKEKDRLQEENETLKDQLNQHKEWIERMQEFCNLPEEERQSAMKTYIEGIEAKKNADEMFTASASLFKNLFGYMLY